MKRQAKPVKLPYFDYLFSAFKRGDTLLENNFGRHVHWGYWEYPAQAALTQEDYAYAAEALSAQICRAGEVHHNQAILDAGCGFGGTLAHINENYQGMTLTGVNIDERQLARAREQVKPIAGNIIAFEQADACFLPFGDCSFDSVLAVECIFHFHSREQFFNEAYRVLKPGGTLALSDFLPKPALKPLVKLKGMEWASVGFYGQCNLDAGIRDYRRFAQVNGLEMLIERDITFNTLPTYRYFRRLSSKRPIYHPFAIIETAAAEIFSRMRWLDYYIFGFRKPR